MTYCVGLKLKAGLVFMSDTRTNAGVDNISIFKKMNSWSVPGERVITLLSSGNLATTQSVISILDERTKALSERAPSILEAPSMFQVARLIGSTLREVILSHALAPGQQADSSFNSTLILGGRIGNGPSRLFLIYPEGNFIEASGDTPFFQIGETKYGKPIIVRAYTPEMTFEEAVKLLLVSFDSTIKSNLSVGLPIDVQFCAEDDRAITHEFRVTEKDSYYHSISSGWSEALRTAFHALEPFSLDRVSKS
ncbi:MAG: peptidase [Phyllobacteriaceae bacterium]|nr:peptidase [Phyllobacteriaceae bacterium]